MYLWKVGKNTDHIASRRIYSSVAPNTPALYQGSYLVHILKFPFLQHYNLIRFQYYFQKT